jgi:hypothetical protein
MASCYAPGQAQSELRQSAAFPGGAVARGTTTRRNLEATWTEKSEKRKAKSLDHSLISYDAFRKTRSYKNPRGEHSLAT